MQKRAGSTTTSRVAATLLVSTLFIMVPLLASTPASAAPQSAAAAPAQQKASMEKKAEAAAPATSTATYVGMDTCETCHQDMYDSFQTNPHWKTTLNTRGGEAKQGCEACHGPGSEHVEDPANPSKIFAFKGMPVKEVNAHCLSCHATGKEQMNFNRSAHSLNNVSCLDCHSVHHAKTDEFLLVKAQPQLCYGCHLQVKPQFNMPFHHRVEEGLIKCTDCHNPHGTFQETQLRSASAQDKVCFTCHIDKRGPFVFEHEAVKEGQGCVACHSPHGSPNPHLLKLSNVNLLCLQCHTTSSFSSAPGTPSFHNQTTQFQACTLCHTQIHGSNFDPFFFK